MRKTDIERLFHLMLGEQLLVETEKKNKMGFCNSYLSVSKKPVAKRKLKSLDRDRLILSVSRALQKAPKSAKIAAPNRRSKVVPLQVSKPVRAATQKFVEDDGDEDDEEPIETIEGINDDDDDDGITLGSTSTRTRSLDSSTSSGHRRGARKGSAGYGDETDTTYIDSDEESSEDSSNEEDVGANQTDSDGDGDDIEIVHGIEDDRGNSDSDIELVPTQHPPKSRITKGKGSTKTNGFVEDSRIMEIRDHHTEHIFWTLHEIAEEVS